MRRMGWERWSWCFALAALHAGASDAAAQAARPRQVAAPASDIVTGVVRLPDPAATPQVSRAAVVPLRFVHEAGVAWVAEAEVPIDRPGTVALALLSPDAASWKLSVGTSGAPLRPIEQAFALERRTQLVGDGLAGWIVDRYDLRAAPAGRWTVRIDAPAAPGARSAPASGWLITRTESDLRVEAWVTTQRLVGGEPIGVVARASGGGALRIESARVFLETEGESQVLSMLDEGRHEDGARGDGLFGALVPAALRGVVRARVEVAGSTAEGAPFLRTAQLAFSVLERRVSLDGSARTSILDDRRLRIALGALPLGPAQRFHVSAEIWGHDPAGAAVPVCWLSRQVDPEVHDGLWSLTLDLDARWLGVAGTSAPLELRAVRVQDPGTEIVFDAADRLPLPVPALPRAASEGAREITPDMLSGSASLGSGASAGPHARAAAVAIAPALMLVHGYCSGGSVWPAADFTQPKLAFLDPNANRTHDQFAQLLDQTAQQAGLSSFGVVAHSQGGAAALHLLTYYQSGLDLASGGRRIQSVASPYQGTPLASLGFFACGVNNNMTPAGAATWLAGIPSWARAEVFTWTTANSGAVCNILTNLFLSDPEDGTVEKFRGELPGGNNMGHVVGWCHTTMMSNPANYTDHVRNQAMNAAAAR